MTLASLAVKRPIATSVLFLAAMLLGAISLARLEITLLPEIAATELNVWVPYPDAGVEQVEESVARPVEEAIVAVRGVHGISTRVLPGGAAIQVRLNPGVDPDLVALGVRERLDATRWELPSGVGRPLLLTGGGGERPVMVLALASGDLAGASEWARTVLKPRLEQIDGVARAQVVGAPKPEVRVTPDPTRMALFGVSASELKNALQAANVEAPGGYVERRGIRYALELETGLAGASDVGAAIVRQSGAQLLRVRDLATVEEGFANPEGLSRLDGQAAVGILLYREAGANLLETADRVHKLLAQIHRDFAGIEVSTVSDPTPFIRQSISGVWQAVWLGGLLAFGILLFFLGDVRSPLFLGTSLPISVLPSFALLDLCGVSLNLMSLGGLALGVGNMMDNAIVVLESIARHRQRGKGVWDATVDGTTEVAVAVTGSTATTVAVFLPIVFVEGIAGQIFRDQAITISASQIISLIVALTLIPVMAALGSLRRDVLAPAAPMTGTPGVEPEARRVRRLEPVLRPAGIGFRWLGRGLTVLLPGILVRGSSLLLRVVNRATDLLLWPLQQLFDRGWNRFASYYPPLLSAALKRPGRTLLVTGLLTAAAIALVPSLGTELVPQFSQGEFAFDLELPSGTPLATTQSMTQSIEESIKGDPRVRVYFASVGESPGMGSAAVERRENVAQLSVAMAHPGDREEEAAVIEKLRSAIGREPNLHATFRRPTYFSFQTPIEVLVFGHDLDELKLYADRLTQEMRGIQGIRDLRSSLEEGSPEAQIEFDRDRVSALGLDLESIARTLRSKIRGDVATRLKERDRQLDIVVRNAEAREVQAGMIENLLVASRDGVPVPLSSVAKVTLGRGPAQITRDGQQRVAVIQADLTGRDLGSATNEVKALLRRVPPPVTLSAALGGQDEEVGVSFRSLLLAGALAVFLVYMCMASEFESFLHPLVIMLAVPLGLVGVVFSLAATHTSVSVVVLIGVILLAGIVVNNAIVLIEYVNQLRKEGRGKVEALLEAGPVRLRPIFMTTITTVLGLVPMALGLGEGAEIRAPMAIGVIGGLTLATLLTLVVVPTVYALVDRKP
ncbi:MAG: efflux RND transporter permease subunit [Candidatus Eisenbacteria bacterium]